MGFYKKQDESGFTVLELIIVLVVIAVLAGLVLSTYSGIQAKVRNNKRDSNINGVQAQLEAYFTMNQKYPTLSDLSSASWVSQNMKNLPLDYLHDPSSKTSGISISSASPKVGTFEYAPSPTGCNDQKIACTSYVLKAKLEGGAGYYTKLSLE